MKFNIDGALPANATLTRASLNLFPYDCNGAPSPDEMYVGRVTSLWNESTITWNNKPSSTGVVTGNHSCSRQQHYADITNIVSAWISGTPNYGLVVYGSKNGNWHRTTSTTEAVQLYLQLVYTLPDSNPPTAPPSNPPATPPANGGSTGSTDSSNGSGGNSTASAPVASTSKPASQAIAPVDKSIKAPVLTSVKKNGKEVKLDKPVEINEKDSLEIFGTSFAGAKIVIFISDIAFETTASADGKWRIVTDNSKFKVGEYYVQAQAQKDGKGSEKVNFFKLKKVEKKSVVTKNQKQSNNLLLIAGVIGTIILLFLIGVLASLRHRRKLNKQKSLNKK